MGSCQQLESQRGNLTLKRLDFLALAESRLHRKHLVPDLFQGSPSDRSHFVLTLGNRGITLPLILIEGLGDFATFIGFLAVQATTLLKEALTNSLSDSQGSFPSLAVHYRHIPDAENKSFPDPLELLPFLLIIHPVLEGPARLGTPLLL